MSETIRHEITLPASPDAVFAALTEEGRFADFYAETIEMWARGDIDPV